MFEVFSNFLFDSSAGAWQLFCQVTGALGNGVAAPEQDAAGTGLIGSVGNLIAAALATSGAYAQAKVLSDYKNALEALAGLCFLFGLVGGIASLAIYGNYRKASYFLIGPPLFYFAITVKSGIQGTELRVGERRIQGSIPDQLRFLKEYVNRSTYGTNAQVSFLFLGYDALVSSVVQGTVSVILDTKNQDDIRFRARERMFSWVIHALPNEGAFVKLLAYGNHGQCSHALSRAMEAHRHFRPGKNGQPGTYDAIGQRLIAEYNRIREERFQLDPQTVTLLRASPRVQQNFAQNNVSCREIWDETARIARELATQILTVEAFRNGASIDQTLPWARILEDVKKALAENSKVPPQDVLAAYLIRNTIARTPLDRFTQEAFTRQPFHADRATNILNKLGESESYGAYMKIVYFAGMIPYIQGLFLYILALSFPFFAVFLVMPSRAGSFLVWFALWAWVKSWDVGFAMVDVARKILWQFMGHGTNAFRTNLDWTKPETVYTLIFYNDPIVTHNTYLQLMAFLTCSVPFVTAHFCLGAANCLDFIKMTVDQNAKNFSDARSRGARRALITSPMERMKDERAHAAGVRAMFEGTAAYLSGNFQSFLNRAQSQLNGPNNPPTAVGQGQNMPVPGGDFSMQRVMGLSYQVGVLNYRFSEDGQRNNAWLGVAAGRLSNFNYTTGSEYIQAFTTQLNFDFMGVNPGMGHNHWTGGVQAPIGPYNQSSGSRNQWSGGSD